jgi:benzoyl-CoA reductase subunit D
MTTVGIDVGSKYVKIIVLNDEGIAASGKREGGFEQAKVTSELLDEILSEKKMSRDDVAVICSTGAGRKVVDFAKETVTEVSAGSRACIELYPDVRTVIDVGAEEGRAIRCNDAGKVEDFAINEKCAAGSGAFTEAMARALELTVEELGKISLESSALVPMNAQCAVFAESEVVSLLHANTPKHDIAKAIHDAIASRIVSMTRRVGINKPVALVGGMARNVGFVDSLNRSLEDTVKIPDNPEMISAYGAALIAADRSN